MQPKNLNPASSAQEDELGDFDHLPDSAYVRVQMVAKIFSISLGSVWIWAKNGHLPKPTKLGPNVTGWNVGELRAVIAQRKAV